MTPWKRSDWIEVVHLDEGVSYEWRDLYAFWSPSAGRYFWYADSGCSCTSWGDMLSSEADFESGDKAALRRAMERFAEESWLAPDPDDLLDELATLARFKEVRA